MENHSVFSRPPTQPASIDDQEILENIGARLHGPMSGFVQKHFGNFQYVHQNDLLEIHATGRASGRYAVPSTAPLPKDFLNWFSNYMPQELDDIRGSWHVSSDNAALEHENGGDSACLVLAVAPSTTSNEQVRWDNAQVVGQFYRDDCVCYRDGLLHLCRSACRVFASQPTRLFLHGFYMRGSLIEFWVFDRSGLYCSDVFNIRKDFIQFLSIILSYQRMIDQDLGKNNIVERDKDGSYVVLESAVMPSLGKLYFDSQPIASREGLVGSGTTCYRAGMPGSNQWNYVLKFKWRWARERPENELLELAKKKSAWGAVSLGYYEELENTANLRRSLRWGTHRRLAGRYSRETRGSIEEQRHDVARNADGFIEHTEETNNFFQNRILVCMVTSPIGRPLHTFQSLSELLQVFRDVIKCHRSLYKAKILHRDISPGNMIILDGQDREKPKGVLIDLDSAVELSEESATESGIIGTRPFMAIGVLKSEFHTYRHDLESLLYVFLWTVITNHTEETPETSKLRQWSNGDWHELALRKSLDMDQENFRGILEEFTPEFQSLKPLAESLRQILFYSQGETFWTDTGGSPEAVDRLYNEMIRAFEEASVSEARK